ncbi:MAG: RNA polymerase sigma factor [Blastocatellia bacterium]
MKFSDMDLITRCLEKDGDAWEALVRRYQRLIVSITVKFGLSAEDTADVFQSVCLILLQQLPHLRNQSKPSSWLITITVRECWKLRERSGKTGFLDDDEWEVVAEKSNGAQLMMDEEVLKIERQQMVRQGIESLPAQCRQLIESLFYSDPQVSYEEISKQLNIPVASIGPTRGRCLAKLREILKKKGLIL